MTDGLSGSGSAAGAGTCSPPMLGRGPLRRVGVLGELLDRWPRRPGLLLPLARSPRRRVLSPVATCVCGCVCRLRQGGCRSAWELARCQMVVLNPQMYFPYLRSTITRLAVAPLSTGKAADFPTTGNIAETSPPYPPCQPW
jgi:hypothetical protein